MHTPNEVIALAAAAGLTAETLCDRAGVHPRTLTRAVAAGRFGRVSTYDRLIAAIPTAAGVAAPGAVVPADAAAAANGDAASGRDGKSSGAGQDCQGIVFSQYIRLIVAPVRKMLRLPPRTGESR